MNTNDENRITKVSPKAEITGQDGREIKTPLNEGHFLEEMLHELKGPLSVAYRYAELLQREAEDQPRLQEVATKLLLALKRTRRVSSSFRFLGKETDGPSFMTRWQSMSPQQLLRIVASCVSDITAIYGSATRQIDCSIDTASFNSSRTSHFKGDADLLEQALFNILDNAFKYSFPNSTIRVALREGGEMINIDVFNRGLELSPRDATNATLRGWRGKQARMITADGAGIGLWIASRIAKVHGGDLRVVSIDVNGLNQVTFSITAQP